MEFPLVPYLTAVLIKLFGFHEALSLVLPLLCGFAIVWTNYCFARRLAGALAALWAGVLTAILPTLVFLTNTGMWADPPSVLFTALGLYYAYRWSESGEAKELWFAGISICLSVLLKLTALYAGIPLLYLLYRRLGPTFWRAKVTWLFGIGVLLPNVAWYYHAYQLAVEYGNTFGIIAGGTMKFGTRDLIMSSFFYKELLRRVFLYHLTPVGTLGFAAGLYKLARTRTPVSIFLFAWLGSIGFYALVAAHGVNGGHYHYFLPFTPVSSIILGIGFAWLLESHERMPAFLRRSPVLASLALALVFFPNAAYASHRFFGRDRLIDSKMWEQKKETGMLVKQIVRPGALIIVCDVQGAHRTKQTSMSPPDVFYFWGQARLVPRRRLGHGGRSYGARQTGRAVLHRLWPIRRRLSFAEGGRVPPAARSLRIAARRRRRHHLRFA